MSVNLAAVRSMHVTEGCTDASGHSARLSQALKGIGLRRPAPAQKLPITHEVLSRIQAITSSSYDMQVMWTAMKLWYFGLLHASEYCVTRNRFDCAKHLCVGDVSLLPKSVMVLFLKCSKTDKFNNGVKLHVVCSKRLCSMFYD